MTTHCRTEMRCTVCVFSPSYYKILWLLWKREVAAREKWETIWRWRFIRVLQTDGLSMLETFWLISQNKGSVKIRFSHCMRFSLTYFKKAAEHRGQCKRVRDAIIFYIKTESEVRCYAACCLIVFLIALLQPGWHWHWLVKWPPVKTHSLTAN